MIIFEGHPTRTKLDSIHARIDALHADIEATESAPIPHSETRDRIKSALEELSVPDHKFRGFQDPDARYVRLPIDQKDAALSIILFLFGVDEVLERIMRNAIECDTRPVGLPAAERKQRLEELRAKVAKGWRESEIEALRIEEESDGADIVERRGNADPEVLLAVWGESGPAIRSSGSPASGPKSTRSLSDMARELNAGAGLSGSVGEMPGMLDINE